MSGYMENLKLFQQALIEATNEKTRKILEAYPGEVVYSKRHERAMKRILNSVGKTVAVDHRRAWSRKRIMAALVAAIVLLFGSLTVYAYRDEIGRFAVRIYENFTKVHYQESGTDNIPDTIEEVRVPTYVPEGYELKEKDISQNSVQVKWENSEKEFIHFEQSIIVSRCNYDNEHSSFEELTVGEYCVYFSNFGSIYTYLWNDGNYLYSIDCHDNLPYEEISQIILSISEKA